MAGAFFYLAWCSLRNRVGVRLRRLREPRYLLGAAVGLLYFYSVFFRSRGRSPYGLGAVLLRYHGQVEVIGALLLLLVAALAWAWPGSSKPALAFTRADVQFLFSAPITRRQLVRYKVFVSQMTATIGSALMTVFFRPASLASGWTFFAGMLIGMATVNLHLTGVALRRQSLQQHGGAGFARQWLPIAIVWGVVAVVVGTIALDWSRLTTLATASAVIAELQGILTTGAAGLVLYPFHAMTRLPLSGTGAVFARALPISLAILLSNYLWIERSDVAFEEASAEMAQRSNQGARGRQALVPKVRGTSPFTLGLQGRPEVALLWKNLILLSRYMSLKLLLRILPLIVVLAFGLSQGGRRTGISHTLAGGCLILAGIAVLMGPQMVRNDLRQDLANLAVIRTWPLRGATVVRGEVLAPTVVLTAIVWLLVVATTFLSTSVPLDAPMTLVNRLGYAIAAMLLAPGLILTQVVVQNTIAIAFPSWVQIGASRGRGVDMMGQRMLMLAGLLVILIVAVLPAAIAGGLVGLGLYFLTRTISAVIPALATALVLFAECALAIEAAGRLLDRTDVSAIDTAE